MYDCQEATEKCLHLFRQEEWLSSKWQQTAYRVIASDFLTRVVVNEADSVAERMEMNLTVEDAHDGSPKKQV